jgi:hypothetical protein
MRPIIFLFNLEYEGANYRKFLTERALTPENKGRFETVIDETLEYYKGVNPDAL